MFNWYITENFSLKVLKLQFLYNGIPLIRTHEIKIQQGDFEALVPSG